jgi:MFS transporter, ACS family, D-galactonate transporter
VGLLVQKTGSYFSAIMFFTGCGALYFVSSLLIDYSRRIPV